MRQEYSNIYVKYGKPPGGIVYRSRRGGLTERKNYYLTVEGSIKYLTSISNRESNSFEVRKTTLRFAVELLMMRIKLTHT